MSTQSNQSSMEARLRLANSCLSQNNHLSQAQGSQSGVYQGQKHESVIRDLLSQLYELYTFLEQHFQFSLFIPKEEIMGQTQKDKKDLFFNNLAKSTAAKSKESSELFSGILKKINQSKHALQTYKLNLRPGYNNKVQLIKNYESAGQEELEHIIDRHQRQKKFASQQSYSNIQDSSFENDKSFDQKYNTISALHGIRHNRATNDEEIQKNEPNNVRYIWIKEQLQVLQK